MNNVKIRGLGELKMRSVKMEIRKMKIELEMMNK
jgi:hypothetical protein